MPRKSSREHGSGSEMRTIWHQPFQQQQVSLQSHSFPPMFLPWHSKAFRRTGWAGRPAKVTFQLLLKWTLKSTLFIFCTSQPQVKNGDGEVAVPFITKWITFFKSKNKKVFLKFLFEQQRHHNIPDTWLPFLHPYEGNLREKLIQRNLFHLVGC